MFNYTEDMRNHYYSAWVEISGKVFVSDDELMQRLSEKFPDKCKWDSEEAVWIDDTSAQEMADTFEEVAQEKISEVFPTDEPIKFNEAIIDMSTYRS